MTTDEELCNKIYSVTALIRAKSDQYMHTDDDLYLSYMRIAREIENIADELHDLQGEQK